LTFCPHKKEQNCYHQTCFRASICTKNAFAAGAPCRTPLGELTAPPDPLAEFVERRRRQREGKGREREREGKRKGGERERKEREGEEGKGVKVAPKRQAWILL